VPLAVVEMFQDPLVASRQDIASWARHDVLLALMSGARGVLVFSGWQRPAFDRYDDYFAAYARVVAEIKRPGTAHALLEGEPLDLTAIRGPSHTEVAVRDGTRRDPSLTARRAGPVTVVVNSAPRAVACRVDGPPASLDAGTAYWTPSARDLTLPPFGSAVLREDG
jgi:hypothetical protein